MSEIGQWLFYSLPWWLQVALIAVPCAFILIALINVLGFERVKGWIIPVAGLIAALGLLSKARQQGYNDKTSVDKREQEKAIDTANDARQRQERADNDPKNLRRDDGFRRD